MTNIAIRQAKPRGKAYKLCNIPKVSLRDAWKKRDEARWTVAAGVIANLTCLRHAENLYIYVGHVVVAALIIRLGWGVVGRGHSRFASFVPGPRGLSGYLKAMQRKR